MKKAIVTGANGFVGNAVVKELTAQGTEVYAVVRHGAKQLEELAALSRVVIVYCDITEYARLEDRISDRGIDAFFHFAWVGSAGELRSDERTQIANVEYACEAVRAAKAIGCKKFIFASSIMEYEVAALMRTTEKAAISTLYSTAKITANYMCRALADSLGIGYLAGVISNIYGPGETSPRLINTTIRKLIRKEHASFSPGEQMYDFIYITDAAKAFVALGRDGIADKTYYIGSRYPHKLKEYLCEMRDVVTPGAELGLGDFPFIGVSLSYREFDVNAVYEDTGFEPEVSFAEGIRRTYEWIAHTMEEK